MAILWIIIQFSKNNSEFNTFNVNYRYRYYKIYFSKIEKMRFTEYICRWRLKSVVHRFSLLKIYRLSTFETLK